MCAAGKVRRRDKVCPLGTKASLAQPSVEHEGSLGSASARLKRCPLRRREVGVGSDHINEGVMTNVFAYYGTLRNSSVVQRLQEYKNSLERVRQIPMSKNLKDVYAQAVCISGKDSKILTEEEAISLLESLGSWKYP